MSDKQQILSSLSALAKRLGRTPSREEFLSQSQISRYFVLRSFRSWNEAVSAAGLRPYSLNAKVEDRQLLEDWGKAVRTSRAVLPRHLYLGKGKYHPWTLARRFGGWLGVPSAFRTFAKGKRQWADVLALLPAVDERKPLSEPVHRISAIREHGGPLKGRLVYGNPIHFRGLRHEPVNEQGVVLLFGMVAHELGYVIEAVQKGFPDCEAKRRVGPDRWQRVHIEFEYESRNFRQHGHPMSGCDVIVCWKHNWPKCPRHIEVVELRSAIEALSELGRRS